MSDFKWEMQERIDAGMNPDAAYEATRDSYAAAYDNRDKFAARTEEIEEQVRRDLEEVGDDDDDASAGGA